MSDKKELEAADKTDGINRRDFLKVLSASFAALTAGGCNFRPPKEKIVPYMELPEGVVPGQSRFYASTCSTCSANCGTLIKTRDGRPVKLEGNPEHPLSRGGLCARGQASILDLYDAQRLKGSFIDGNPASWKDTDIVVGKVLSNLKKQKGGLRVLTQTVTSPSLKASIRALTGRHSNAKHIQYDSVSASAILDAHKLAFGRRVLPHFHFNKARSIVSFDADFLGTWISPVEFSKDWVSNRRPDTDWDMMSWHAQYEGRMSVTGANADLRVPVKPSELFSVVSTLAERIADKTGWKGRRPFTAVKTKAEDWGIEEVAKMLLREKGRSLVISGSSDVGLQVLVAWMNQMLGNYGSTVDITSPSNQMAGNDKEFEKLLEDMKGGSVDTLIVAGANPAYDHPKAKEFKKALEKVSTLIAVSQSKNETASLAKVICADTHHLESWSDSEPGHGIYGVIQPAISPLFDSRPAIESFLAWAQKPATAYSQSKQNKFQAFWDEAVSRGFTDVPKRELPPASFKRTAFEFVRPHRDPVVRNFEFTAYPSVALYDGAQANNPWLQELPDPVTKACWGNYASFSTEDAKRLGLEEGRVVRINFEGATADLPAHIQLGQPSGMVAAALGYGRTHAGPIAANYPMEKMFPIEKELLGGADVYPLLHAPGITITKLEKMSPLAKTQRYDRLTDPITGHRRPHVQETTLQDFFKDPTSGRPEMPPVGPGMWPKHKYEGHKWAMAVDLNACTGCSSCVVACQAENNTPVVGKAEVRKSRDMYWMRIDRYYGESDEDPSAAFQPMMCQQCDNAPCETVCPVLATVHSTEGLNMQVYNRCVGTRYCANNCPYKTRRFNWFDYAHEDLLQNLALNPDITVRTRGVMEKCTFCVQRIQEAKAQARSEGRQIQDGEAVSACMQSCPTDAIVFGDINDPNSKIAKIAAEPRTYTVLGELGVGPSVFYRTKVRNKKV
jgi:molybdopterin-containing oxidoreductase family iron-sulfur binding subunit